MLNKNNSGDISPSMSRDQVPRPSDVERSTRNMMALLFAIFNFVVFGTILGVLIYTVASDVCYGLGGSDFGGKYDGSGAYYNGGGEYYNRQNWQRIEQCSRARQGGGAPKSPLVFALVWTVLSACLIALGGCTLLGIVTPRGFYHVFSPKKFKVTNMSVVVLIGGLFSFASTLLVFSGIFGLLWRYSPMATDENGKSYYSGTNVSEGVFALVSLFLSFLYFSFGMFLFSQSGISLTCVVKKNSHPDEHYVAMDAARPDVLCRGNSFSHGAVQTSGVLLDGPLLPRVLSGDGLVGCGEQGGGGVDPEDPPSLARARSPPGRGAAPDVPVVLPVRRSVSFAALPQGVQG